MRLLTPTLLAVLVLPALAAPISAQRAQPGWIGIAIDEPAEGRTGAAREEVRIAAVYRGSPAEEAGVRRGDRLISVGDLEGADDFRNLPERLRLRVGEPVRVRVERDGRRLDFVLRAGERPDDVRSRTLMLSVEPDSLVETMVRAMDSLRVQLSQVRGVREPAPGPGPMRIVGDDARPAGVSAPFEFFVFRGEAHDSLREAWAELSRVAEELREDEQRRLQELRRAAGRTGVVDEDRDPELRSLRIALEEVTRRSAELRSAMSEAARVTAGFDFVRPPRPDPGLRADRRVEPDTEPSPTFSPLTPYLVGSNMVAGAQVVDLNPGLARYFDVEGGVLIVEVTPGTPAALAGMMPGDVITRLDQVAVRTVEDLRFGVSRSPGSLPVRLVREGSTLEVLLISR